MSFYHTYFNSTQLWLLSLGALFLLFSAYTQAKNKEILTSLLLFLATVCIFSFAALLDPFLNKWDERFHALVAKNLMLHPLKPTLYDDPVVNMLYDGWDKFHIWLHKQPLFLWQVALSFKIFGVSEFTLRLPSILLGAFLVIATYRTGKLLVNTQVGYIASVLVITNTYLIELVAGRQEVDHNDFVFLVYVSLSIWSFIEYQYTKKRFWIYFIGLFSGMAILCKWLVGLLVYFGWFTFKFFQKEYQWKQNRDLIISLSVTIAISMPWQIFCLYVYSEEASRAFAYNAMHLTMAVEGHGGDFWYHFQRFPVIFGAFAAYAILPAFFFFYRINTQKKLFYPLISMVVFVYVFFAFAPTKMPSFTIIVAMMVFIVLATMYGVILSWVEQHIPKKLYSKYIFVVAIFLLAFLRFDLQILKEKHSLSDENNHYSKKLVQNKQLFKSLDLPSNTVLFNVKGRNYIEAMFYTGLPAYNFIPTHGQYIDLKKKGRNMAVFRVRELELPEYLKRDSSVVYIDKEIL